MTVSTALRNSASTSISLHFHPGLSWETSLPPFPWLFQHLEPVELPWSTGRAPRLVLGLCHLPRSASLLPGTPNRQGPAAQASTPAPCPCTCTRRWGPARALLCCQRPPHGTAGAGCPDKQQGLCAVQLCLLPPACVCRTSGGTPKTAELSPPAMAEGCPGSMSCLEVAGTVGCHLPRNLVMLPSHLPVAWDLEHPWGGIRGGWHRLPPSTGGTQKGRRLWWQRSLPPPLPADELLGHRWP